MPTRKELLAFSGDYGSLSDEALMKLTDELFVMYDKEEQQDEVSANVTESDH
jgi:hypothetical protein